MCCSCGNEKDARLYDILNGKIVTCSKCGDNKWNGQTFGDLQVIYSYYNKEKKERICVCKCSCGNTIERRLNSLINSLKNSNKINCGKCDSFLMIGKTFGKVKVIDTFYKKDNRNKNRLWCVCRCSCGTIKNIRATSLKSNKNISCGKCREKDLIGKIFGELTVIDTFYKRDNRNKNNLWCKCKCSCGKTHNVIAKNLTRKCNPQISCGCLNVSKGQKYIENWLHQHDIEFSTEETFNKDVGLRTGKSSYLRYDIFVPKNNLIIEFDGIQHYTPIDMWGGTKAQSKTKNNDKIKNEWAKQNKYILHRFNYKDTKQYIDMKLKELLLL